MKTKNLTVIAIFCMLFVLGNGVAAAAELSTLKINDNLYVVLGGNGQGSHVGVSVGEKNIVLIDAMKQESNDKLLKAIVSISNKPVKYVVNTHDHSDHTGGNTLFSDSGATIVAHDNANYEKDLNLIRFASKLTLNHGGEQIELAHVTSHSASDTIIFLENSNVGFMGDVFTTGWYPAFFQGGLAGQKKAIDLVLSWSDDNTKIVPGHGEVSSKADLLAYKNASILWVDRIMTLHKMGMNLDDMLLDKKLNEIRGMFNKPSTNQEGFDRWFQDLVKNTVQIESELAM